MTVKAQFPHEQSEEGRFVRQQDAFRSWVSTDGSTPFALEPGRYHLYVSWACPWAHRTIIVRRLMGLENAVGMTVVDPIRDQHGWAFRDVPDASPDPVNGFRFLSEAYHTTDPSYRGRVTVPVLWDKATHRIVSNSDDDVMRMFETTFTPLAKHPVDLYPEPLRAQIDELNDFIYENINDGVYRAGFATQQAAYEQAAYRLFEALDRLDERLRTRRYLFGLKVVETDIRLFVTLVRFDPVYHGHFKCNLRRIVDYPNLSGYLRDVYQTAGVADTVNFDHIKRHYYVTHDDINPTRIVPIGPLQDLWAPHARERLAST
ncbi:MAG: glutathione S-transferase family protein [Candidatus Eremiobacteraeota bacterium]|nr:glutathione S-transferase family protein [Candidatus Eremiobacteraeota bacterium]MBV9647925.1 glutathione S-transferase family protein [Candidatus Eremiobacteraeota bacterium]